MTGYLVRLAFSPDNKQVAVTERDSAVRVYDTATGKRLHSWTVKLNNPFENYTSAVAYSPDGKLIAAGATDHVIYLWDAATGKEAGQLKGTGWYPWGLAFTADSKTLFSTGWDGVVRRWDVAGASNCRCPTAACAVRTRWPRPPTANGWPTPTIPVSCGWSMRKPAANSNNCNRKTAVSTGWRFRGQPAARGRR